MKVVRRSLAFLLFFIAAKKHELCGTVTRRGSVVLELAVAALAQHDAIIIVITRMHVEVQGTRGFSCTLPLAIFGCCWHFLYVFVRV